MPLTISNTQAANTKATNLMNSWKFLAKQTADLISNGQETLGNQVAFSSTDFTTALGTTNIATLQSLINILIPPTQS